MDRETAARAVDLLEQAYPEAKCTLSYTKDYELLYAARLAAQCTDERVDKVTPVLFARYPTLEALSKARQEDVEAIIRPCGFYHMKARDIIACSKVLLERHGGRVPDTMEELLALPGVGRKTANLVLGDLFGKPAVVTDTHCIRIANRLGMAHTEEPGKVEKELRALLPMERASDFCHRLVLHGRSVCLARTAYCGRCVLDGLCEKRWVRHLIAKEEPGGAE